MNSSSFQLLTPLFSITRRIGKNHPIYCFPIGDTPNTVSHIFIMHDKSLSVLSFINLL